MRNAECGMNNQTEKARNAEWGMEKKKMETRIPLDF
jgi:hypothetical protein